mgnify:FL=1
MSNPGFESYNSCPNSFVSMPFTPNYDVFPTVLDWTTPVKQTTPDYMNDCVSTGGSWTTPNTLFGYQVPHSGTAYSGIIAFQGQYTNGILTYDYREYLQTRLKKPMVAGKQYCVRFYVSPTISANFNYNYVALDEVGANFSVNRPTDTQNRTISLPYHIVNTPGNFLTDTAKWYRIGGTYTAQGGEEWLTIGCFNGNGTVLAHTQVYPPIPNPALPSWNYLFVDDVIVTEMSSADTITRTWDTTLCSTTGLYKTFQGVNNALSYRWQDGSTGSHYTAIDTGIYWCISYMECGFVADTFRIWYAPAKKLDLGNDSVNCFSQPVTIAANYPFDTYSWSTGHNTRSITVNQTGTYALQVSDICGIQTDTIRVVIQPPTPPPVVRDTLICQYVQQPTLQVQGTDLVWYYPNSSTPLSQQPYVMTDILGLHTFYVAQKIGYCESPKVPIEITVKPGPVADIGDYHALCTGRDSVIGRAYSNVSYLWNTGERTPYIYPKKTGTYQLSVTNECGTASDTAFVEIFPCDDCLFLPNAFTPNGDGRNDIFAPVIKCPVYNYRLRIYNRWGEEIFSSQDLSRGWNGMNGSERADVGVYAYLLEYNSANTRFRKFLKGNVTLIR